MLRDGAPGAEAGLREGLARHGVEPHVFSTNLARRADLARDVETAAREGCDVFLTELKAAAIDVVAEAAARAGAEVVFLRNRPVAQEGERALDELLLELVDARVTASAGAVVEARP